MIGERLIRLRADPFWQGVAAGYALPFLVVAPALFAGRLDPLFSDGQVYWLLPVFAALGVPGFLLGRFVRLAHPTANAAALSTGLLSGGWAAGSLLLWASAANRPISNRLSIAVFGGALMVGFWLWIGAVLGAARPESAEAI